MKRYALMSVFVGLTACSTSEKQMAEMLKKNPQIVFEAIEANPEQFIEVVNRAAKKAQETYQQKQYSDSKKQQEDQFKNPLKPVLAEERMLSGSRTGDIVIVEYADFQCPACRMAFDNLKSIREKYKDRIRFYYKNMPLSFHKMAMPAALYYEAVAKQDKLKAQKYYDLLFESQNQMVDEAFLKVAAKKVGADMKKLSSDLKDPKIKDLIAADMAEFEKFGFTGTPSIVINGVALNGAQPTEEIEKLIGLTTNSGRR
jgi:protein-disulfide isomerase